jgi:ribosomal protein S18 acetylase RimI-like enzyme
MGKRGRYGKYGEVKRLSRLRTGKFDSFNIPVTQVVGTQKTINRKIHEAQGKHVTIRTAETSDADFIRNLSERVFLQYGPYEEMLPRWLESGIAVTFLAIMDKKPIGFAMLSEPNYTWSFSPVCELLAIAVAPEKQRLHVAERLMEKMERTAREFKVGKLILHTYAENSPAQNLFRKRGFIATKLKKEFYPKGQDACMMYKNLRGE